MTAFAQTLSRQPQEAATVQTNERTRRCVVRRSTLGAVQSRFEATIANLEISSENTAAARARIVDADFAQRVLHGLGHLVPGVAVGQAEQAQRYALAVGVGLEAHFVE